LKHTARWVDNSVQVSDKNIYLDHQTGNHFDVVISVVPETFVSPEGEMSMLWSKVLRQANLTKQNYNRLYKQKQRRDPDMNENENAKMTKQNMANKRKHALETSRSRHSNGRTTEK